MSSFAIVVLVFIVCAFAYCAYVEYLKHKQEIARIKADTLVKPEHPLTISGSTIKESLKRHGIDLDKADKDKKDEYVPFPPGTIIMIYQPDYKGQAVIEHWYPHLYYYRAIEYPKPNNMLARYFKVPPYAIQYNGTKSLVRDKSGEWVIEQPRPTTEKLEPIP